MARIQIHSEHQDLARIQIRIGVPKWRDLKREFCVRLRSLIWPVVPSWGRADAECQRFSWRDQTKEYAKIFRGMIHQSINRFTVGPT